MEIQNFTVTITNGIPTITGTIKQNGVIVKDFTGANTVNFFTAFGTLTPLQQRDLMDRVAILLLQQLAGLA